MVSDRLGEFGECRSDSQLARSLGGECVVATAKILQDREPADDYLSGLVGAQFFAAWVTQAAVDARWCRGRGPGGWHVR